MLFVLSSLLPVFMLIALGYILRHTLMPVQEEWMGLERLSYYVLFPALLIYTLSRADFNSVPVLGVGGALMLAVLLMSGLCLALRPFLASRFGVDGPAFSSVFQGATRWQTYIALAVSSNLLGDRGLALASVAMIAMIPILNVLCVWVLAHYASPQRLPFLAVIKAISGNPLTWACVVGLVINLVKIPLPVPVSDFVDALGRASLALGLVTVGAGLKPKELFRPQAVALLSVGLKLIVMPAMAIALGVLFGLNREGLIIVACCTAIPTSPQSYVLARQMNGDAPLIAQIITLQTVFAAVTMPIMLSLVQ
jgi:malonate transporter